jgi:hypothetical protein
LLREPWAGINIPFGEGTGNIGGKTNRPADIPCASTVGLLLVCQEKRAGEKGEKEEKERWKREC